MTFNGFAHRVRATARLVVAIVAMTLVAGTAFAAAGKDATSGAAHALPEPLTREAVHDLVARLSDAEVRKLLLDQLERAAAGSAKPAGAAGMAGMVGDSTEMIRRRFDELGGALVALPATLQTVGAKLTEPDGLPRLLLIAAMLAASLAVGWIAERLYDRSLRSYRDRLRQAPAMSYSANAVRLATQLALEAVGIVVYGVAAVGLLLALWHDHFLQRRTMFVIVVAVLAVRFVALLGRFLLAPRAANERLLPFADAPARALQRFVVALAAVFAAFVAIGAVLQGAGVGAATRDLLVVGVAVLVTAMVVSTVWRVREPIATLIRGNGTAHPIARWLADLWPVLATVYFVAIAATRIWEVLAGEAAMTGQGILSILLVIAVPIVDMALCRALAAAAAPPDASAVSHRPRILATYESVFRRAIHIVTVVIGLVVLARLWDIDVFALAQQSMGGRIASSLFGVCIVLLLAFMVWEIAKTAIDRRLTSEADFDPEYPASRLRTLLPIMRVLILVTIVAMATMSVLAALGVDILPLLAGASVIGVAIGFGSQTLVRDVVSGAFFLMDDAFRLGEYIEVGSDKGRVEKINVRSLFLRHHRGAINILPYGEIKRLRNTSRDWVVMVLDFRLTYDTSLLQVKKILKQIGDEIAADPELAPNLLQPLKFGGVTATEDSAIVVRAKFMARPDREPWMIQKAAYTKIIKAFREAGIKFAHKEVTVNVPPGFEGDRATLAAEGAAALAARDSAPPR